MRDATAPPSGLGDPSDGDARQGRSNLAVMLVVTTNDNPG